MNREQLIELLERVKSGALGIDQAVERFRLAPFEDLGFAKIDEHRHLRCGFPEVVYAEGKTPEQLELVFDRQRSLGVGCLATRVSPAQAERVTNRFSACEYDPIGRTAWLGTISPSAGRVTIVTAGTSDLPVAQEAHTTARVMGCDTELLVDVGVAGLHRLLKHEPILAKADCIVVVAGMEGALPSVVGGLVDCPVLAVPTSVGYGASLNGMAALLGMLSSCAANVAVVNIDAGFKAGYVAALIARRANTKP